MVFDVEDMLTIMTYVMQTIESIFASKFLLLINKQTKQMAKEDILLYFVLLSPLKILYAEDQKIPMYYFTL